MTTSHQPSRSTIAALRDLVPLRPLNHAEAMTVAERQANKLLALSGVSRLPVDLSFIWQLPRLDVKLNSDMGDSGGTGWSRLTGRWLIAINSTEPPVRQRFTLAHEFKHVLDHPFLDWLYPDVAPAERLRHYRVEQLCDYFAACLLMPRTWVTNAYYKQGIQRLDLLARRFGVSQMAMRVRLLQLGIIEPLPRCGPYRRLSSVGLLLEEAV